MRRVLQLLAVVAWVALAAHDHEVALAVAPTLALLLVADEAPGAELLARWARRAPRRRTPRPVRRRRIAAAHRATGRPFVLAPFSSRPPPAAHAA